MPPIGEAVTSVRGLILAASVQSCSCESRKAEQHCWVELNRNSKQGERRIEWKQRDLDRIWSRFETNPSRVVFRILFEVKKKEEILSRAGKMIEENQRI